MAVGRSDNHVSCGTVLSVFVLFNFPVDIDPTQYSTLIFDFISHFIDSVYTD